MLNFENELKKFQPILDIDKIERRIATEDMIDIIDLMKVESPGKKMKAFVKNDDVGKEI